MDKLTTKLYKEYKDKIDLSGVVHSVQYEMLTAILNKSLLRCWQELEDTEPNRFPPHYYHQLKAKIEALIALITDLTVDCIELFLQEPDSMAYEPEEPDGIE